MSNLSSNRVIVVLFKRQHFKIMSEQQVKAIEIPLIGKDSEEWINIDCEAIVSGKYGISTPDGKQLNDQQVCAVLLMECWYLEKEELFKTPLGQYLLADIEQKSDLSLEPNDKFLTEWFDSDFTLIGFAGSGKTQSLQAFLYRIKQHAHLSITVTAPTNKALKVIKAFGKSSNIVGCEYQTIYQAMGYKLEVNDDGVEKAEPDPKGNQNLNEFDLAILDEASMFNALMYSRVTGLNNRPRFIYMGDSKQLKPVGDKSISPVFTNVLASYTLSRVMRYPEGSAIARLVETVRDNVGSTDWIDPRDYANGEDVVVTDNEDFLDRLIEDLKSEQYQSNPDYVKVVSYTNVVVDWVNEYCHKQLYGNKADAFIPGERLVSTKPVTRKRIGQREVILKNRFEVDCLSVRTDEFTVEASEPLAMFEQYIEAQFPNTIEHKEKGKTIKLQTQDLRRSLESTTKPFKIWKVRATVVDEDRRVNLDILDPTERQRFNSVREVLKLIALCVPKGSHERKVAWALMYRFIEFVDPVVHSYCLTVHGSQGSSFNHVYVTAKDLLRCKDALERSQLHYVAYSRAMEKLIISL